MSTSDREELTNLILVAMERGAPTSEVHDLVDECEMMRQDAMAADVADSNKGRAS